MKFEVEKMFVFFVVYMCLLFREYTFSWHCTWSRVLGLWVRVESMSMRSLFLYFMY